MNFRELAERYEVSGGDIKNAVLKAATMAAAEPLDDMAKMITHSHFERAMQEVVSAKGVMQQSLFGENEMSSEDKMLRAVEGAELRWRKSAQIAIGIGAAGFGLGFIALMVELIRTF